MRSALHRAGLCFRKYFAPLHGRRIKVDVAFSRQCVVVQVDGSFWHACPEHGTRPTSNSDYWTEKLRRNVERDRQGDAVLAEAGIGRGLYEVL